MADEIKNSIGKEVELIEGGRGEFTVWVNDKMVVKKVGDDFPPEKEILDAVRKELSR